MTIEVDVEHRLGAFRIAARFASAGPLTALFENWWPGLRTGGTLMFRSIHHGDPGSEAARRLLARLATRPDARCLPAVGQWARVVALGQQGQGPEEPEASGVAGRAGYQLH